MIAYTVAVFCDAPDCEGSYTHDTVHRTDRAALDARAAARDYGWARRRIDGLMVDICPDHCAEPGPAVPVHDDTTEGPE